MTRQAAIMLAGLGFLAISPEGAAAAAPDYCALYAREQARVSPEGDTAEALQRAQDKAFYQCLNMDEAPPLPEDSAYADDALGAGVTAEGDASAGDETLIEPDPAPAPKPKRTRSAKASGSHRGSGFKQGSPEWKAWCQEHYPNSFDPKTGTVLPLGGGGRTMCP